MKQSPQTADRKSQILDSIAQFLTRFRRAILGTLIIVAAVVIGLVVYLSVQSNRAERALESVETLTASYREWVATVDTDETQSVVSAFQEIEASAQELVELYDGTYAAVRARMIVADGNFELENWLDAGTGYTEVAQETDGTYLNAVALLAAGVAFENAEDLVGALERYRELADNGDRGFGLVPRALFSVGRIEESRDEIIAASEAYQTLIDDYPTSSWTNLARNRIITLTVQGRLGE